jgi:hypothetical protein
MSRIVFWFRVRLELLLSLADGYVARAVDTTRSRL